MSRRGGAIPPPDLSCRSSQAAVEVAIMRACFGEREGDFMGTDLRGFLEESGVLPEDVEAILAAPHGLAVYRRLVRNGLSTVVLRMLPLTRARLNAACNGRFDSDFARFVDDVGPRTHYVRDVPGEFFAWADPRWRADPKVPAYLPYLAAHELAHFSIAASDAEEGPPSLGEVALDRPLAFSCTTRLLAYDWAVHELPADEASRDEPAHRDVRLLGYRDASHAVRWLELTPLAASILGRLVSGEPLGAAVERACEERGTSPTSVLEGIVKLLADLGTRGVVLGARMD
jgi:uncharacterized protein